MKKLVVVGLLLAFLSSGSATYAKQPSHVFVCITDAECAVEWEEVYG